MHIVIFDGDPRPRGTALDAALLRYAAEVVANGNRCERVRLADLTFHECVGCFDCWLKTPGRCRLRDDGEQLVAAMVRADLLVHAAPMRVGFVSSLLRRSHDRVIPFLLPYTRLVEGECHHRMRYHALDIALWLERGDSSPDELAITRRIYHRLAKNTAGKLAWCKVMDAMGTRELPSDN